MRTGKDALALSFKISGFGVVIVVLEGRGGIKLLPIRIPVKSLKRAILEDNSGPARNNNGFNIWTNHMLRRCRVVLLLNER